MLAVQSPTWSSEGILEPLESSLKVQLDPKTLQELLKTLQETPERLQVGLQRRPREVQELQNSSPSAIRQQTAPPCKNHEKHCKVLQKSRFGRTAIDGKMSLGGKLRPLLTPSWLVRVQVGAKRGIGRSQESSKSHIRRPRRRTRATEDDQESAKMAPKARSGRSMGSRWAVGGAGRWNGGGQRRRGEEVNLLWRLCGVAATDLARRQGAADN